MSGKQHFVSLIETVKTLTEDVCIEFGFKREEKTTSEYLQFNNSLIEDLGEDAIYKYFTIEEHINVEYEKIRHKAE